MVTQPPDLLVHSGNWQEHSFDSSVVTEGHYDASFESEVPPMGLSMEKADNSNGTHNYISTTTVHNNVTTAAAPCVNTPAMTTIPNNHHKQMILQNKARPPKIAQTAKKSVFSVSGLTSSEAMVTTTGPSSVTNTKPNSLMLWKKVQSYVVVGGALVGELTATGNAEGATNAPITTTTTASSNVQHSRDSGGQLTMA